jgi:hypothetical protein
MAFGSYFDHGNCPQRGQFPCYRLKYNWLIKNEYGGMSIFAVGLMVVGIERLPYSLRFSPKNLARSTYGNNGHLPMHEEYYPWV